MNSACSTVEGALALDQVSLDVNCIAPMMLRHLGHNTRKAQRLEQCVQVAHELAVLVQVARVDLAIDNVYVS